MRPKISTIFLDIHGTVLPKFSCILNFSNIMNDSYMQTATEEFEKLNTYCKNNNIKIIIISGGTLMEVNELVHFFKLDVCGYYCEQGAIYSLDAGNTWQLAEYIKPDIRQIYLMYLTELKKEFNIDVLSMSYRIVLNLVCENISKTCEKFKTFSMGYHMNVYPIYVDHNKVTYMVTLNTINKYNAIKHYTSIQNINESEVLFYGNGSNDLDAFINGTHHKLVSTTPQFFFNIDNTYESSIDKLKLADDLLVYGLTKYLGI